VKKQRIVVTAGPTYEPIDAVRVITNLSTGLMGYEIAKEAKRRGFSVTLITGPTSLTPPKGTKTVRVMTAGEMYKETRSASKNADCLIMAAAVADFKVAHKIEGKIKKQKELILKLSQNIDILKNIPRGRLKAKVGFALESSDLIGNARRKMIDKKLDLIVANKIGGKARPFGKGNKDFILLQPGKRPAYFKNKPKERIARAILDTLKNSVL